MYKKVLAYFWKLYKKKNCIWFLSLTWKIFNFYPTSYSYLRSHITVHQPSQRIDYNQQRMLSVHEREGKLLVIFSGRKIAAIKSVAYDMRATHRLQEDHKKFKKKLFFLIICIISYFVTVKYNYLANMIRYGDVAHQKRQRCTIRKFSSLWYIIRNNPPVLSQQCFQLENLFANGVVGNIALCEIREN